MRTSWIIFPGTGKDRFKYLLNGKTILPLILYTECYGSSLVERALKEPTEENLIGLFKRMKKADVFTKAVEMVEDFVEEALKTVSFLPFDSKPVIRFVSEYFDGIFAKLENLSS